jgi:RNA recognition motif-containing protein
MNIYVGNLPYSVRDQDLMTLFSEHGTVSSAKVVIDRETDRSKGFGFVEMPSADEGTNAINKLNGFEFAGRALRVNEARPREERPRTGGGGGGGYGRGGGGGGGGYGGGGGSGDGGNGGERRPRRW